MSWLFLIVSAFLFSSGFLFNKLYQRSIGASLRSSLIYSLIGAVVMCLSMLVIGGAQVQFTWFALGMATLYAINSVAITFCGIRAFQYANLSVYSVFLMLGSIVLPSAVGMLFYGEQLTLTRLLCFALICLSLYASISKGETNCKAIPYYLAVFTMNGLAGVLSKIHQSQPTMNVSSNDFLFITGVVRFVISAVCLLAIFRTEGLPSLKPCLHAVTGNLFNAVGNYMGLFALLSIPIMVHSVVTTGGVLVGSALIGFVFLKEKPTKKGVVSILFALAATVLSAF